MWLTTKTGNYKKFISENEEIRDWFTVTSERKKVWNIELWILEEFKRICEKHNIRYYADCGTLLWAIRHHWFIPWDDDMDVVMFREDFDKFLKLASKELHEPYELLRGCAWIFRLMNTNTTCLWDYNWRNKDFKWWIYIDIFPMNFASRFKIINRFKYKILYFLEIILFQQKAYRGINKIKGWKKYVSKTWYHLLKNINCEKIWKIQDSIDKKIFYKWNDVYHWFNKYLFYPESIYKESNDVKFENTTICVPSWYHVFLKSMYNDYNKPVINKWWHKFWYSVDKSYKDIIKTFDKTKSNEENYKNCKDLFTLD